MSQEGNAGDGAGNEGSGQDVYGFNSVDELGKAYGELRAKHSGGNNQDFSNMSISEKSALVYGEGSKDYKSDLSADWQSKSEGISKQYGLPREVADSIIKEVGGEVKKDSKLTKAQEKDAFIENPENVAALKAYLVANKKDLAQFEVDVNSGRIGLEDLQVYAKYGRESMGDEISSAFDPDGASALTGEQASAAYERLIKTQSRQLNDPSDPKHELVKGQYRRLCKSLGLNPMV